MQDSIGTVLHLFCLPVLHDLSFRSQAIEINKF